MVAGDTLPPHCPKSPMSASTLPQRSHHRHWLARLGNLFKLFKKVAKRCRGRQHRERVASESPTVVTVLHEVANTSPPGCQ